jgi:hypothetical protein
LVLRPRLIHSMYFLSRTITLLLSPLPSATRASQNSSGPFVSRRLRCVEAWMFEKEGPTLVATLAEALRNLAGT